LISRHSLPSFPNPSRQLKLVERSRERNACTLPAASLSDPRQPVASEVFGQRWWYLRPRTQSDHLLQIGSDRRSLDSAHQSLTYRAPAEARQEAL